jgi:hypothetical protein
MRCRCRSSFYTPSLLPSDIPRQSADHAPCWDNGGSDIYIMIYWGCCALGSSRTLHAAGDSVQLHRRYYSAWLLCCLLRSRSRTAHHS